jgi:hypothetical protein
MVWIVVPIPLFFLSFVYLFQYLIHFSPSIFKPKHPQGMASTASTASTASKPYYKNCAKVKEAQPNALSGVYDIMVNGSSKQIHCDMDKYGEMFLMFLFKLFNVMVSSHPNSCNPPST